MKRRPARAEAHRLGPYVGFILNAIAPDRHGAGGLNCAAPRIIHIDDRSFLLLLSLRSHIMKEAQLCAEVVVHRAMEIEMILRQIGKDRHVEFDAGGPVQGQRMG